MDKLISAEKLYNKIVELEELARNRVLDTPTTSPAYPRYVAQLNERTSLKHMIMDEPAAFDKKKVKYFLDKASDYYETGEQGRERVQMVDLTEAIEIVEKGGV